MIKCGAFKVPFTKNIFIYFCFLLFAVYLLIFYHSSSKNDLHLYNILGKRALDGAFQEHLLQNMLEDKIPRKIQRRKDSKNRTYILQWRRPWGVLTEGWNQGVQFGECVVTHDRAKLRDAAAVVFHYSAIDAEPMPWRHYRDPEQAFVFYTMESPPFIRNIEKRLHFAKFNGLINWTMSYRSDADVFFSYLRTESLLDFLQRNHSIDEIVLKKKNVALWLVSKCGSTKGNSLRWHYAMEMVKAGLPLQGFGDCFNNRGRYEALDTDTQDSFKFYLSFENVRGCKDYVSEKFWYHGILSMRVPVVYGSKKKDLLRLVPPNSFIHADDFDSPVELTRYLLQLHNDDSAYAKYFSWLKDLNQHKVGVLSRYLPNRMELLCEMAVKSRRRKTVENLESFLYGMESEECLSG